MNQPWQHIDRLVRQKLGLLPPESPDDWPDFAPKLVQAERALQRRRWLALGGHALALLILVSASSTLNLPPVKHSFEQAPEATATELALTKKGWHLPPGPSALGLKLRVMPNYPPEEGVLPPAFPREKPSRESGKPAELITLPKRDLAEPKVEQAAKPGLFLDADDVKRFLAIRAPNYRTIVDYQPELYVSPLQESNPWTFTLDVYPNFTFRKFKVDPNRTARLHSDFVDAMEDSEKSGFSLNLGIGISRRIGKVTYVNSGLEYITNTYRANFRFDNFREALIDPLSGEITGYQLLLEEKEVAINDHNSFHYLNLPLSISHQPWINKHLRLNLEAGISYLRFLKAEGTTLDYKTLAVVDLSDRQYRDAMGSLSLKVGVQYYLTDKLNLGFEPTFMYFTNTIYTSAYPYYVIPYSLGVNFNLQLKLN